jgi:hypothetical protein
MSQIGRISGPLLEANLLRLGLVESSNEYLAFHNNSVTDNLIYLDVVQSKIGIRDGSPSDELRIRDDFKTTSLIVETLLTVDEIEIRNNNSITSLFQPLEFAASSYIFSENIRTNSINIDDNVISTVTSNSDIELRPNGSGSLEVHSDFNITGNLSATGDLTLGGDITIGDSNTDSIIFAADLASDLTPDQTGVFSLGGSGRRWSEVHPILFNGQQITVGGISIGAGVNPALRPGKIWFVAQNGLDTNQGNHENGPFATIKHALGQATADDTVYIYPGVYDEDLPLVVPTGVSVTGANIRTVVIRPDTDTQSNDVFLLNGETTVSNLTVKDFYYDSINDTGYAFRFAPGFKVTSRSPYVQNVTVLTRGTSAGIADPRGFNSGDAGKGALVDGSVADSTTREASMLFHSITFITPGVDALTMTNGVRVEWLNSFTYFADRGLYATAGVGRTSQDGSTLRYGAEVRSIGSANVYGNYGAWADGQDTLMYLINHNFAYIGTQGDENNDGSARIQENETVELATGRIYYQSLDQEGDFRVGDVFNIDAQTGLISINGISTSASGITAINFGNETSETNIDATEVNTGNIRFRENTLSSLSGPVTLKSATGVINVTQNVLITRDLTVTGNTHIAGQVTIGNQPVDIVDIGADIEFDLRPNIDNFYELGSELKQWNTVYINSTARIDNALEIATTKIETIESNSDLELLASGTGRIYVPTNDVDIGNVTVNQVTNFSNTVVTGLILQTGNIIQTGNTVQTGNIDLTGNTTITNNVSFQDIEFIGNTITTSLSNSDLELLANGTGRIYVPSNDVEIDQQLQVIGSITTTEIITTGTITSDQFTTGDILIDDNFITTTQSNSDLELLANNLGRIYVPGNDVEIDQDLTINNVSNFANLNITGTTIHQGNTIQSGNIVQTGNVSITQTLTVDQQAYFNEIALIDNRITTTSSNADLELYAGGTGNIYIPLDPVRIDNDLTVVGASYTSNISNSTLVTSNTFTNTVANLTGNIIDTLTPDTDLILEAAGTGIISVPTQSVELNQNLTVDDVTNLANTNITGTLVHVGAATQTGSVTHSGNFEISNNITVGNDLYFDDISIVNNVITTTLSNSNLELRAAQFGSIKVPLDNVRADLRVTVTGLTTTSNITNSGTVTSDIFLTSDTEISDNYFISRSGTSNLRLQGNNTGGAVLEKLKFNSNIISTESNNDNIVLTPGTAKSVLIDSVTAVRIPNGTIAGRTANLQGDLRFTTDDNLFSGWSSVRRTFGGVYSANRQTFARAHPTNNTINFVAGGISAFELLTDKVRTNGLLVDNQTSINNNLILNTVADSDLILESTGIGLVGLNNASVIANEIGNLSNTDRLTFKSSVDGYLKIAGTTAFVIPFGGDSARPLLPEVGDLRFNTDSESAEVYNGTQYTPITGTGDVATEEIVRELGDYWSLILG